MVSAAAASPNPVTVAHRNLFVRGSIPEPLSSRWSEVPPPSTQHQRNVRHWSDNEFQESIANRLWALLPFARLDLTLDYDRTELARAYADSYQRLERAADEVARMFHAVGDLVTLQRWDKRVEKKVRSEWQQRHRAVIDELIRTPLVPPDTVLTARSVAQPELAKRLLTSLEQTVKQFVASLVSDLDGMSRNKMVGRITWASPVDCSFVFYRHGLTQEWLHRETNVTDDTDSISRKRARITSARDTVRNTTSLMSCEHHLMNAQQHKLERTLFPLPLPIQAFVKTIPEWLRPEVGVVEGTQIRERICEVETSRTVWTSEFSEVSRVLFHNDPALVLGPYVLTAWGQQEVEAETQRLRDERTCKESAWANRSQQSLTRLATAMMVAAVVASFGLTVLAYAWKSSLCLGVGVVAGLLGVALHFVASGTAAGRFGELDARAGMLSASKTLLGCLAFQALFYSVAWGDWLVGLMAVVGVVGLLACWGLNHLTGTVDLTPNARR